MEKYTDGERLNAIDQMGNIAIWHGQWVGEKIVRIYKMDEDCEDLGDHIISGETLRDAVDNYLNAAKRLRVFHLN